MKVMIFVLYFAVRLEAPASYGKVSAAKGASHAKGLMFLFNDMSHLGISWANSSSES